MSAIKKNQIVDNQIQIPVELLRKESDLFVVSLILPRTYFREPFLLILLQNHLIF